MDQDLAAIFRFAFPNGCKVVVVDSEDRLFWGKLTWDEWSVTVERRGKSDRITWERVEFICQDQVEFHKVKGPMPGEDEIREQVAYDIRTSLDWTAKEFLKRTRPRPARLRRGDPWEIEGDMSIHNVGNDGPQHWGEETAETIVVRQPSGIAMLWAIDTVFEFERVAA